MFLMAVATVVLAVAVVVVGVKVVVGGLISLERILARKRVS